MATGGPCGAPPFVVRAPWSNTAVLQSHTERAPRHRYGAVLLLTIATFTFTLAATSEDRWVRVVTIGLQGATLIAAVRVSDAPRRLQRLSVAVVVVAVLGGAMTVAFAADNGRGATHLLEALLAIVAPLAVAAGLRRQLREEGVTLQVVFGALSIYLLLGLSFAFVYGAVAEYSSAAFFYQAGIGDGTSADRTYFSFVTLTTTGYGDLTANVGVPRALAILEAIFGQLYLVTVVALVISNLGRGRPAQSDHSGSA
jgi:hypothetical protein